MRRPQRGAALAIALILLAALALLSLAGLGSAAVAFEVASHDLRRAQAFEAAERATLAVLAGRNWPASGAGATATVMPVATPGVEASAQVSRIDGRGQPVGFSLGEGGAGFTLQHYAVTATGRAPLGATVVLEQGIAVLQATP